MDELGRNSELFEKKSGGGFLMLFGLPFFLAGLSIMGVAFFGEASNQIGSMLGFAAFGSIFALVGGGLMFGRAGIILDKRRNTLTQWKGLLVPMSKKELPLDECEKVLLKKEIRRSDKSTYTVYPVYLEVAGKDIKVEESRQFDKGRALSEELSKFLALPVCDSTSGQEHIREAGTMDMSLRDQLAASGESIEIPDQPENMTSTINFNAGAKEVIVEIPAGGLPGTAKFIMLVPLLGFGVMFFFIYNFMSDFSSGGGIFPIAFIFIFIAFSAVPALAVILKMKRMFSAVVSVTASPSSITVENAAGTMKKIVTIPASEVEEMFLTFESQVSGEIKVPKFLVGLSGNGIVVRSDKENLTFGSHLSKEEAIYIHALLKKVLTS